MYKSKVISASLAALGLSLSLSLVRATDVSVQMDNDLSRPTFGLQGPVSSSLTYNTNNGFDAKGALGDVLGPPIKIAKGIGSILEGSNIAGLGASLKNNGAVLGFDAKLLEAAGGANLLKGGLLMGGAAAKVGGASLLGGLPGKKISSIIELPVKVVAMKDLAAGKGLMTAGKIKEAKAVKEKLEGLKMVKQGDEMKAQGMKQVLEGATEGVQNIGKFVEHTAGNVNSAISLLPIMLDLPMQNAQVQQQQQQHFEEIAKGAQEETKGQIATSAASSDPLKQGLLGMANPLLAGFGGLGGLGGLGNMFNPNKQGQDSLAAVLNKENPIANLLLNPGLNPFLLPIMGGPLGPLGPLGLSNKGLGGVSSSNHFNLFPGIKVHENSHSSLPA